MRITHTTDSRDREREREEEEEEERRSRCIIITSCPNVELNRRGNRYFVDMVSATGRERER